MPRTFLLIIVAATTNVWSTIAGAIESQPWNANDLQNAIDVAIASDFQNNTISVPPGDYYFFHRNLNITHAHNLSIIPNGNATLWFSGIAGVNISHSTTVRIGDGTFHVVIDYDPPPPQHTTFHEKSGITLHLYNCTRIRVHNVVIRAAPFMVVTAFQGGGDHVFRNLQLHPAPNRTVVGVRDALHFSDLRKGPTVVDSTIGYTGDDFFNVHSTLMLVLKCTVVQASQMECLIVNPRVMVDARPETVYGTISTLRFVKANRDVMSFFQWPATDMIMKPVIHGALVQSIDNVSEEWGALAQKTLPPLLRYPSTMSWIQATNQTTNFSAREVWKVLLNTEETSTPPKVGSIVTIDTIASTEAKLINNTFLYTHCNIGRFKSTGGVIQGNIFRQARINNLEVSALPQWFEGPIDVRDIRISDNRMEGQNSPIHCGPLCEKPTCHPGQCATCPSCQHDSFWARNVTLTNNTMFPTTKDAIQ